MSAIQVYPKTIFQFTEDIDEDVPSEEKVIKLTTNLVGNEVRVLGSWDDWKTERLMHRKHNPLRDCDESFIELVVKNGMSYEFKFKINGDYVIDETMPTIRNRFGTLNNRMIVRDSANHIDSPNAAHSIRQNSQPAKEIEPKGMSWVMQCGSGRGSLWKNSGTASSGTASATSVISCSSSEESVGVPSRAISSALKQVI